MFEAARWAPSSYNAQQWRALYAWRGTENWNCFLSYLAKATKHGRRMRLFLLFLFRARILIQQQAIDDTLLRCRFGLGELRIAGLQAAPGRARHARTSQLSLFGEEAAVIFAGVCRESVPRAASVAPS
jgi:hypothetical protein